MMILDAYGSIIQMIDLPSHQVHERNYLHK